jgi:hypothetical protein
VRPSVCALASARSLGKWVSLLARRAAADPNLIGVLSCASLFNNSHWAIAVNRFFTVDGEPRSDLIKTVIESHASKPRQISVINNGHAIECPPESQN